MGLAEHEARKKFEATAEVDAALRAEVTSTFPEKPQGTSRLKPLADTLERFHAFHDSLNSISARSSDRLERVVAWLRG